MPRVTKRGKHELPKTRGGCLWKLFAVIVFLAIALFIAFQVFSSEEQVPSTLTPTPQVDSPEPTPIPTPEQVPTESLEVIETPRIDPFGEVEAEMFLHAEYVHYSIYYFSDGVWYSSDESSAMPAASVIKIFIMQYAYLLIERGELAESDMIGGHTVRRLIELMVQRSDNTATNILIDRFGMENINQFILEQGFSDTVLQRRMLDMDARNQGFDNYTSTRDAMEFLRRLYDNRMVFPYSEMLEIMEGQEIRTKIHLFLPSGTVVASKTGELPDVENDMGLVFTEGGVFAIVVFSDGVRNTTAARQAIGQLALQAYDYAVGGR